MCGLIAVFDRGGRPVEPALLRRMRDAIVHRGPDDAGDALLDDGQVGLASRRLAIIDLSVAGHMPMAADGMTIAYNGEVYNFAGLRAELERDGHRFRSGTDTEVVLAGLRRDGTAFLRKMIGMFALAAWDERGGELILARDPAGKKPLYYAWAGERLYVASEIKALLLAPEIGRAIDPVALQQYLALQFVMPPRTLFAGIGKLAPGEAMVVGRAGPPRVERYWRPLAGDTPVPADHAAAVAQVRTTLESAVADRMVADVPIGAYLSGGLDSSLVVAMMQRRSDRPVDAFTITYPELPDRDEAPFAEIVAKHCGARLHRVPMNHVQARDGLEEYPYHADEPIADPASINAYWTSRGLRGHGVVVALVGEGADELFLGYPGYFQYGRLARLWRLNRAVPRPLRRLESAALAWLMARTGRGRHADVARRLVDLDTLFLTHETGFDLPEMRALLGDGPALAARPHPAAVIADLQAGFAAAAGDDILKLVSTSDLRSRVAEKLLMRVDKMSMAHSLEARAPFLDRRVVELALALPGAMLGVPHPARRRRPRGCCAPSPGPICRRPSSAARRWASSRRSPNGCRPTWAMPSPMRSTPARSSATASCGRTPAERCWRGTARRAGCRSSCGTCCRWRCGTAASGSTASRQPRPAAAFPPQFGRNPAASFRPCPTDRGVKR
ncbi:MAG: asparagine synthase (glutamine-hydrolyzing) [Alphaproteobacteria bacterium]